LHLSLLALGVGKGDEVITTPMTFVATATAILHTGAKPVFVDVEPDTALIDPTKIRSAITSRTKAIIPVHLYGQMCDMKMIKSIADEHGLKVIEDAAHCIEGEREGIKPGQLSDVACFSFYATKNITSGEGGAVATRGRDLAEKVRLLRTHGMSKEAAERYSGIYQHWDLIECGWKYNMDNIHASLLLPQLDRIETYWAHRKALYGDYVNSLEHITGLEYPRIADNSKSAYHLFTIWVDPKRRDAILHGLGKAGIGAAVNYRAIHLLSHLAQTLGSQRGDFPIAEDIGDRTISLPFYVGLQPEEIKYVATELKRLFDEKA
jgi:dTDP-4-amino-4,6-dideoxygalactose transaminase